MNFANVVTTARKKPPFGIGQIGKSFRNEITPGNFIFRTREFEQMEMEFFVEPATAKEWHQYWIDNRLQWYIDLGIRRENLRLWEHPKDKLSHYSDRTVDIEYKFGFMGNPWVNWKVWPTEPILTYRRMRGIPASTCLSTTRSTMFGTRRTSSSRQLA